MKTIHTHLSYTNPDGALFSLSYFNGTYVEDVKNELIIIEIECSYSNGAIKMYNGLYWVNNSSYAYLVNSPITIFDPDPENDPNVEPSENSKPENPDTDISGDENIITAG